MKKPKKIIPASPKDYPEILELLKKLPMATPGPSPVSFVFVIPPSFLAELIKKEMVFITKEENGNIVGCTIFFREEDFQLFDTFYTS